MNVQEPPASANLTTQRYSNSIADQSKQAHFPERLVGREVTQNDSTQSLLSPELHALISSYVSSDEIQEINGQAGGLLDTLPDIIKVRAQSEARTQKTLKIRGQDITTAMLQAIRRDFPILLDLDVEGSTLNGSDYFKATDIQALLPQHPFLTITGMTLQMRLKCAKEKLELWEAQTHYLESEYMKCQLKRSTQKSAIAESSFRSCDELLQKSLRELKQLKLDYNKLLQELT